MGFPMGGWTRQRNPVSLKSPHQKAPLNCAAVLNGLLDTAHDARVNLSCVAGYPTSLARAKVKCDRLDPMVEQLTTLAQELQQYALIIASRHGWLLAAHHFNPLHKRGKRLFTQVLTNVFKQLGLALNR